MKGIVIKRSAVLAIMALTVNAANVAIPVTPVEAASKIAVKATGITLREGSVLTKKMVKKAVKVTKNGKKTNNFTVVQVGKPVKNGKCKLTVKIGKSSKKVSVKVNRVKAIYIKQCKLVSLEEGSKLSTSLKKKLSVMAEYKKGKPKKITTYTISPNVATPNSKGEVVITVKYRKFKDKISIPVVPKHVPSTSEPSTAPTEEPVATSTAEPSTAPTEKPTATPTEEPVATSTTEPSTAPTEKPTATPTEKPSATPTEKPPVKPPVYTKVPTEKPLATPTETPPVYTNVPTATPTATPSVTPTLHTVTVERTERGKVIADGETLDFYNNVATFASSTKRSILEAIPADGYIFINWTKNGKAFSTNPKISVPITDNVIFTANFADASKAVNVTFQHENGQVLSSQAVALGETLAPPTKGLWKANQVLEGWKIGNTLYRGKETDSEFYDTSGNALSDAIKQFTKKGENVVVVSSYTTDIVIYHSLTLQGGSIVSYTGGEVIDAGITEGTHVYIKPDVPIGKYFAGWANGNGDILSNEELYNFFMNSDMTLKAVYADAPVKKEPIAHFAGAEFDLFPSDRGVRIYTSLEVPDGYERIEWGLLYTNENLSEDKLTVGSIAFSITNPSSGTGSIDWSYDITFSQSAWQAKTTLYFRIYAIVQGPEGTQTIYSNILPVKLATS